MCADTIAITTFYRFLPLAPEPIAALKTRLEQVAEGANLRGLCLLSAEGINATVSASRSADLVCFKAVVQEALELHDLQFKDSSGKKHPFREFKVKVKNEIVTLGKPGFCPTLPHNDHITPKQWQADIRDPDTVVLDTRNAYEIKIGKFRRAVDLGLKEFNEFPQRVKSLNANKDQRILMYCTGGIRCEKAILEMRAQGFKNVAQLEGGILNYLKEFPEHDYQGECFVFDYRVAVDQNLQATSSYRLCPHCGQPGKTAITCCKCARQEVICEACFDQNQTHPTCSKNCAHHRAVNSGSRKPHLPELSKRHRR